MYEDNMYQSQEKLFDKSFDSDISKLYDLMGKLHPYCYKPEKDASELSGSNSDTNKDESSEEKNVSLNNAEINRAGHTVWCIWECCKKEISYIDCLCCQEVAVIPGENFEGNKCIAMSKQF